MKINNIKVGMKLRLISHEKYNYSLLELGDILKVHKKDDKSRIYYLLIEGLCFYVDNMLSRCWEEVEE